MNPITAIMGPTCGQCCQTNQEEATQQGEATQ